MVPDFLIYIIFGFFVLLLGFLIFQVLKLKRRLDIFLKKGDKDLGSVLRDLIEKTGIQEENIKRIFEKISKLEKISEISFQKVGVVRYNPFKDVGGDQSFSVALLDGQNSGFVITSLYMRERTRVFAKPVMQGRSEYSLSEEEKRAINKAMGLKF